MFILRSVRNWLTLLFLVLTALAALAVWLYVVPPLRTRLVNQKLKDLTANAPLITDRIQPVSEVEGQFFADRKALNANVEEIDRRLDARVVVIAAESGAVIVDSRNAEVRLKDYPMVARAIRTGMTQPGTTRVGKTEYAAAAVPVIAVDEESAEPLGTVVVVLVTSSLRDVDSAVQLVTRQILLATVLALAVTLICGYLASYLISRRLKSIENSAEAIAGGDFDVTVGVRVHDEIGQLASTFNIMGGRLEEAFSELEREKRNVETLLNTLSEGVIGLTADGRVAVANPAAVVFLDRPLPPGSSIDEVFPPEVAELWRSVHLAPQEPLDGADRVVKGAADELQQVVLELGARTLEAFTYTVGRGRAFDSIVVLRDITEEARLEQARRDFVANASHEFKTPLFSLAGILELLDDEDLNEEERAEFLALMKEQVDRLQALSLKLLDLSQVDAGAVRLHVTACDATALAHSVLSEFQARAAERHLKTDVVATPGPALVTCDEERLAQVLRALVDNAIKYTPDGGNVELRVSSSDSEVALTVADNGRGIPPEELPRVFERFYRGSTSRASRAGTGLGLSIARELAGIMGGSLTGESRVGVGSRFTVSLPAARDDVRAAWLADHPSTHSVAPVPPHTHPPAKDPASD